MVHKPKHKVHSFRGLLGDGGQDEINLERSNLNLAYRIIKLDIMPNQPGDASSENVVLVWREAQTTIPTGGERIDFSDVDVLGAAYFTSGSAAAQASFLSSIFDNILFSRNIFVTHTDNGGSTSCNYYLELEEVPVGAATLMQLKLQVARKLNLSENAPDA